MAEGENQQQQQQQQDQNQQQQQHQQKPWYDGIDAETMGHWENKGWKKDDPKDIALNATKQARELQKHFGVPENQLLKLPKDTADEAGWKAVRERLGAPKEAKEYDLSGVKFKDGRDMDMGLADAMRAAMHKAGTPKDAAPEIAKAVVGFMDGKEAATASERAAAIKAERDALTKEWGPNWEFNRLTAMQGARRAAGSDEDAVKIVEAMQNEIGYKKTMEFWRKIGAGTTEDTFVEAGQGNGSPTTRAGAVARKAELMADKDWSARYLKGGAAERREMDALNLLMHGEAA